MLVGKVAGRAQEMQPDADSWKKSLAVGFEHFQVVPINPRCAGSLNEREEKTNKVENASMCIFGSPQVEGTFERWYSADEMRGRRLAMGRVKAN
jgi:hypothetical protein